MGAAFLPHNYVRHMYQRLQDVRQGSWMVDEYTSEFYHLLARNEISDSEDQTVTHYIRGLHQNIQDFVDLFDLVYVSKAY